jgi:DNA-binding response OmpR family regulator
MMSEGNYSVLLVDDDPHICEIFELVMKHHHMPFMVTTDGETALNYLRTNSPDIVIMDIFLPGIDGFQALKSIRKEAQSPKCRVIATTAYYTNDTQQEVLQRGFDGYIPKPFGPEALMNYLADMASGL